MTREELEAEAKKVGLKVNKNWTDETLLQKLTESDPNGDEDAEADNLIAAMGEPLVKVICTCDNVHLGDGRILRNREKADIPESLAKFLDKREQVSII